MAVRFQTPLEEIPVGSKSLLEQLVEFLMADESRVAQTDLFQEYEKDRGVLMAGKERFERGELRLEEEGGPALAVGLLLLHLKFQTEPLLSSQVYERACQIILETKGSTALGSAFRDLINSLAPQRQAAVRSFFQYLWRLQAQPNNGLDSIALATRFGNFLLRPPSGSEPTLPRVKLMGALAVLIESFPRSVETPLPAGSKTSASAAAPESPAPPAAAAAAVSAPQSTSRSSMGTTTASTSLNSVTATAPERKASVALSGVQVSDVSRSAIVVIDSSLKALNKLKDATANCNDEEQLTALLKRLKYLDSVMGEGETKSQQQNEYSI